MEEQGKDQSVLTHDERLVAEEPRLFEDGHLDPDKSKRFAQVQVQFDQCRDLLRLRRALRETGGAPSRAHLRAADIVKKYIA
jgi:hypothetical protein